MGRPAHRFCTAPGRRAKRVARSARRLGGAVVMCGNKTTLGVGNAVQRIHADAYGSGHGADERDWERPPSRVARPRSACVPTKDA